VADQTAPEPFYDRDADRERTEQEAEAAPFTPEELQRALVQVEQQKRAAGIEEIPISFATKVVGELELKCRWLEVKRNQAEEFAGTLIREKREREQAEAAATNGEVEGEAAEERFKTR
jgi:hypothetical protein